MKRKIKISVAIISIMILIFSLTACGTEVRMPKRQGSNIFLLKTEDITGFVIDEYDNFDEFSKGDIADVTLGSCNEVAKKSYYTKDFFKDHKLITVKFNVKTTKLFLESVSKADNTYNIYVTAIGEDDKNLINTAICCVELGRDENIKDASIKFSLTSENEFDGIPTIEGVNNNIMYSNSILDSTKPLEVVTINDMTERDSYIAKANTVTKAILESYQETFFENNYLFGVDYLTKAIGTYVTIHINGNVITLNSYSSDHYQYNDETERVVRFIAMPKSRTISKVILNDYWTNDLGENKEPIVTTIDR